MIERDLEAEQEFLRTYDASAWPHPSLTADVCAFRHAGGEVQVLLIRRGGHPYRGFWALPGGFSEPSEDIEQTAAREAAEETGLEDLALERTYLYSGPDRDPRGWVATQVFVTMVDGQAKPAAGDDAADAQWFAIDVHRTSASLCLTLVGADGTLSIDAAIEQLPYTATPRTASAQGEGLAFDHARLVADAYLYMEQRLQPSSLDTEQRLQPSSQGA